MTRQRLLILMALAAYLALVVIDNLRSGEPFNLFDLVVDLVQTALLAFAVLMTSVASVEARALRRERIELIEDLAHARREGEEWRARSRAHLEGLGRAIAQQFADWGLTEAETDVAGLLVKGLSHKEIAELRGGSEATVRQHATSVYRKSGLATRAQLTAYFLEDILAPQPLRAKLAVLDRSRV